MSTTKPFIIEDRIKSFGFAFKGIQTFIKTQHNSWIHCVASILVLFLGYFLKVTINEWCMLIFSIAIVVISEMLNTAIEFICDFISPQIHPQIKKIKDIAAGAVLVAVFAAVIIGTIIFLPKIINCF